MFLVVLRLSNHPSSGKCSTQNTFPFMQAQIDTKTIAKTAKLRSSTESKFWREFHQFYYQQHWDKVKIVTFSVW